MYNEAILKNADIVVCDINNTDGRNNTYEKCLRSTSKWSFLKDMFYSQVTWSNCNKLFRRSLYDNNYYTTTNAMGEDMTITLQIAYYAKVIAYVHKPFYCYYSNPASIMKVASTEAVERKYFQMLSNVQIIQRFYENKNVGFDINKAIKGLLLHCSVILVPALNDKNEKLWNNNNKQFGIYPLLDSCVRLRYKAIFCAYHMGIYSMLKRLSHIL